MTLKASHAVYTPIGVAVFRLFFGGCAGLGLGFGTGSSVTINSAQEPVSLRPNLPTRVYRPIDANNADIYLTDLPDEVLDDPEALGRSSGQILHIRMFLVPRPGRTPIEETAFSATARYFILSAGRVGVYSGGGFLFPRGRPGGDTFGGSMSEATLRLVARGPGFVDQIGSAELSVGFKARRDEELARLIGRTADRLALSADPIDPEQAGVKLPSLDDQPVTTEDGTVPEGDGEPE